jgi:hypothetical protein
MRFACGNRHEPFLTSQIPGTPYLIPAVHNLGENGDFREALGVNWTGSKRVYKVAAPPTSYRRAHSRSRIFSSQKNASSCLRTTFLS